MMGGGGLGSDRSSYWKPKKIRECETLHPKIPGIKIFYQKNTRFSTSILIFSIKETLRLKKYLTELLTQKNTKGVNFQPQKNTLDFPILYTASTLGGHLTDTDILISRSPELVWSCSLINKHLSNILLGVVETTFCSSLHFLLPVFCLFSGDPNTWAPFLKLEFRVSFRTVNVENWILLDVFSVILRSNLVL